MAQSRLSTALDGEFLVLPEGKIAVMRPAAGMDLSALPREAVEISHTFRPDHDAWAAAGYAVSQKAGKAKVAIVCVPRAKELARAMIAEACTLADLVLVDGQREDGVDSLWRDVRSKIGDVAVIAKAHGRLFWFEASDAFAAWAAKAPAQVDGFYTQAGVFSDDGIDRASELLAAALPEKLAARVADLGAGWGYLTSAILQRQEVKSVDLYEAEALALECAKLNIQDPRAKFHWEDVTRLRLERAYDTVVMNPPFHAGSKADPALGRAFIQMAAKLLHPGGHLWMVANRHLPYEAVLKERFKEVEELPSAGSGFKIFHAAKPVKAK